MSRKGMIRRKSLISIAIVIVVLCITAFFTIKIIEKNVAKKEAEEIDKVIGTEYYTNISEDDLMKDEYGKIDAKLNGVFAFAKSDDKIVGIKSKDEAVDILNIDKDRDYDLCYDDTRLYIAQKDNGLVRIVNLKTENGEYSSNTVIDLAKSIDSFKIYKNVMYYISNGVLYKNEAGIEEVLLSDITSNSLVVKKNNIYVCQNSTFVRINEEGVVEKLKEDVTAINYYNYYEKHKIVLDCYADEQNCFKNLFNVYTGEITQSIRNKSYFIPYGANGYLYTSNDGSILNVISSEGIGNTIYNSEKNIDEILFIKDRYILITESGKQKLIDVNSKKIDENYINKYEDIYYIK